MRAKVRDLAAERLDEVHADALLAFVAEVEAVQEERNEVLHSRWLLRGSDSMKPVSQFLSLSEDERLTYLHQWEREARASEGWKLQRNRSMELTQRFQMQQLVQLERRLARAENVAVQWHFRLAGMRESDTPAGWRGPDEAPRGPQPLPPGALTGEAASEALKAFFDQRRASHDS